MRVLYGGSRVVPDEEIFFNECILYIISRKEDAEATIEEIYLDYGYDEPISLAEIAEGHPDVVILIEETALSGRVFPYKLPLSVIVVAVPETIGFA